MLAIGSPVRQCCFHKRSNASLRSVYSRFLVMGASDSGPSPLNLDIMNIMLEIMNIAMAIRETIFIRNKNALM